MNMLRTGIATTAGLAAMASAAWAQQNAPIYGGHMWGDGGHGGWFLGPIMMIVFVALLVVAVVFIVRWLGGSDLARRGPSGDAALDILKQRFARGEIDRDEFEDRRQVLGG